MSHLDIGTLFEGFASSISLVREMFPPDFARWEKIPPLAMETIAIGFWGTILGMLISFPLGFLSAKNTSGNIVLYNISKGLVNFLRAIPDILYALLFVVSIGMGAVAGVLALAFSTIGLLSKFYAEAVESIDTKPVEAIEATGGHSLSVIRHAVLPQVFPLFMGYNLYALDHNIRAAMMLGLVGAGGLGVELFFQMRSFNYQKAAAIIVIMFVIITVIDRVSAYLRNRIIEGTFLNKQNRIKDFSLLSIIFIITILSLYFIPVSFKEIAHGMPRIWEFLNSMFPPDFSDISSYVKLMAETVGMGISGTFIAVLISVPMGMLSARNMAHRPLIYNLMKEIANFFRAMPELMFALIFVAAVGLGPFAGVLVIAIHTAGFLGKFYAEAIENVDPKPVEAVEATGARFIQRIRHSVFPQVMPLFNSYNLYILDRNIRASTVMGIVGAGGIGFDLVMSMKLFEYQKTATLILIILFTVMLVDWLSSYLRKKVV
ncbi:MAG: phosphonate ABC transporter, permease protein PhnE [Nitrospirae bacterium]|nr:phosphonate ABC transporter, permease protein PhnE [Nitrospirota bacterium]